MTGLSSDGYVSGKSSSQSHQTFKRRSNPFRYLDAQLLYCSYHRQMSIHSWQISPVEELSLDDTQNQPARKFLPLRRTSPPDSREQAQREETLDCKSVVYSGLPCRVRAAFGPWCRSPGDMHNLRRSVGWLDCHVP